MSINEKTALIEEILKDVSASLQNHSTKQADLQQVVVSLNEKLNIFKSQVEAEHLHISNDLIKLNDEIQSLVSKFKKSVRKLEDVPCIKVPKWYVIEIPYQPIVYSEELRELVSQTLTNYVNINSEGPFALTQITPLWRITEEAETALFASFSTFANPYVPVPVLAPTPKGRTLPCTAFGNIVNVLGIINSERLYNSPSLSGLLSVSTVGGVPGNPLKGPLSDLPEWSFQIEIGGSGRFWTSQYIPAAAFYGIQGEPTYLATPGYVQQNDRIIVHAKQESPIFHKGVIKIVLHGYQMLGKTDISKALGY